MALTVETPDLNVCWALGVAKWKIFFQIKFYHLLLGILDIKDHFYHNISLRGLHINFRRPLKVLASA